MNPDAWPGEGVMLRPFPPVPPTTPDPYYLRGLLYCRLCGEALRPAFSSNGERLYDCPTQDCEQPWVAAERAEREIWARFGELNREAAARVSPERRQESLTVVLNRVTVGPRPDDLEYDWRD